MENNVNNKQGSKKEVFQKSSLFQKTDVFQVFQLVLQEKGVPRDKSNILNTMSEVFQRALKRPKTGESIQKVETKDTSPLTPLVSPLPDEFWMWLAEEAYYSYLDELIDGMHGS